MKKGKWSFLTGAAVAGIIVSTTFDVRGLEAVSRLVNWHNMQPELRLANEVGLVSLTPKSFEKLEFPTRRCDFAEHLRQMFSMLGATPISSISDFSALGILDRSDGKRAISRKEAVETFCRTLLYLSENGYITLKAPQAADFSDYKAPEKYRQALAFLREKGIVKGLPDGSLQGKRFISRRETIFLMYRFYEQISLLLGEKRQGKELMFVDLPLDHFILENLRYVKCFGAFEFINLGGSFDGNRLMSVDQMTGMLGGILKKGSRNDILGDIQNAIGEASSLSGLNRGQMAVFMDILIRTFHPKDGLATMISYTDLSDTRLSLAAKTLAGIGIQLGYPDGRMAPGEMVSRFEAISLLNSVLKRVHHDTFAVNLEPDPQPNVLAMANSQETAPAIPIFQQEYFALKSPTSFGHDAPAEKSDIEEYSNVLRSKLARIKLLLARKPMALRK